MFLSAYPSKEVMDDMENMAKDVAREVKLQVNERLYQKGVITEEMYTKAKNLILKS